MIIEQIIEWGPINPVMISIVGYWTVGSVMWAIFHFPCLFNVGLSLGSFSLVCFWLMDFITYWATFFFKYFICLNFFNFFYKRYTDTLELGSRPHGQREKKNEVSIVHPTPISTILAAQVFISLKVKVLFYVFFRDVSNYKFYLF